MENSYKTKERIVPMIPLRGIWILPKNTINFEAGREFSINAIQEAEQKDSYVFLTTQKDTFMEEFDIDNINSFGVLAKIKQSITMPDGVVKVMVEGVNRAKIEKYREQDKFYEVLIKEYIYEDKRDTIEIEALKQSAMDLLSKLREYKTDIPFEFELLLDDIKNFSDYVDDLIFHLRPDNLYLIQELVEELDPSKRLIELIKYMERTIDILEYKQILSKKINHKINTSQKEYYLREQLQIIKKELEQIEGNGESFEEDYERRIKDLDISDDNKAHLLKELNRLEFTPNGSPEVNVIRTYLDNVLDVPFGKYTDDQISINKSREVLDKDHYGLKDVKERILEYLAVLELKKDMKGSILCLVGPPGVGKTSIVKSVAESMNREYISMRLGGVTDESEIRGHRKTYIGAMPGRIITSLQKAKTLNPVFLFDEIDKISSSYKANPASALLEVLDPNQNNEFLDRYIEIPVDLSKVLFITTANTTQTIPQALLDRMEVINLSGYTEYDKLMIAKKYLVPKQIEAHGLSSDQISISDSVIKKTIKNYTRESGVRNLEREIAKICRKAAMRIVEGAEKVNISLRNYRDFLGNEKILDDDIQKTPAVGIVTGLAWTTVGGELLQIEVNTMSGKGKLQLTGSLGDVMKESGVAALSYIKSNMDKLGIKKERIDELDIHVHVPEGATPKDGPSAGITITTGIVSAITGKKVRQDIAMTGEVTIRGRVLPIGGLKEKALAAKRYGINNVIIPNQNERDLEDIPESIRNEMKFYPVSHVEEVLKLALLNDESE